MQAYCYQAFQSFIESTKIRTNRLGSFQQAEITNSYWFGIKKESENPSGTNVKHKIGELWTKEDRYSNNIRSVRSNLCEKTTVQPESTVRSLVYVLIGELIVKIIGKACHKYSVCILSKEITMLVNKVCFVNQRLNPFP